MVKVLQDIWILKEDSGIVVFHRVFDDKLDVQLFGGLMSALNSFAEQLSKEGISSFELSNKRFTLMKKKGFLFVASSDKDEREKRVKNELQRISEKFFDSYPPEVLENWDSDISMFKDFREEIEESLEETVKKFQKAFW